MVTPMPQPRPPRPRPPAPRRRPLDVAAVALGAVAVVLVAPDAAAQVPTIPPTPVVPPPVLDTIVEEFRVAVEGARPALLRIASGTFGVLAVIEIALSGVIWTFQKDTAWDVLGSLVLKLAWLGFAFSLLASFPAWFPPVIEGFHQAGQTVAPGVVSPGDVLGLGVQLSTSMVNGFFEGVGLMDFSFALVSTAILVAISAFVVELMYAVIAATVVVVLVESFIALAAGALVLGFAAFRGTANMADRFVAYVFNLGIRLFSLFLLVGIGFNVAQGWLPLIQGGTDDVAAMLAVLGGSLTFMLLVVVIPYKVSTTLTRDLTVGFERALNSA